MIARSLLFMLSFHTMSDYLQPAPPRDRVLAAMVDFCGSSLVWALLAKLGLPVIGMLLATFYILLRDGTEGQSLGKRWRKICTINLDNQIPCAWKESILRNLLVAIPFLGYFSLAVETYFAFKDRDNRRYGDRFAHTMVVRLASLEEEDD